MAYRSSSEYSPGECAPAIGIYEQINIFGQPNGIRADVAQGHPFPAAPIGHFWRRVEGDGREDEMPAAGRLDGPCL